MLLYFIIQQKHLIYKIKCVKIVYNIMSSHISSSLSIRHYNIGTVTWYKLKCCLSLLVFGITVCNCVSSVIDLYQTVSKNTLSK